MKNLNNNEKSKEIKDKTINVQNEEILTNFEYYKIFNSKIIDKNSFLTNYPYSIKNISTIKKDNSRLILE